MTVEVTKPRSSRRHTHKPNGNEADATEHSPWCGAAVTREEYTKICRRIETEERRRIAALERELQQKFAREVVQAESKKKIEMEKILKAEREGFAKKIAETIGTERAKAFTERMKLDERLQELQRQLQQRRSVELGEEQEIEIFDKLQKKIFRAIPFLEQEKEDLAEIFGI